MVDWINYTRNNATTLSGQLNATATTMHEATGNDIFFPLLLMTVFIGAAAFGSRYGFERAGLFSSLVTTFFAFGFVAAGILDPSWLILTISLSGVFFFLKV